jgi:hypothetical protein
VPAPRAQELAEAQGFDLRGFKVGCPAGTKCHLPLGVECAVEESFIDAATEPSSILAYCAGRYTTCPSWRSEKENRWAQKKAIHLNHPKRPGRTILDQDPETIPTYRIPRETDGQPERLN